MSAQQVFCLCLDCWMFDYGVADKNGVWQRDSSASNHWDHSVHVFGVPNDYPPPIRAILTALQAGLPISDGRMEMFSLACAVTAIQPTNGVKPSMPQTESTADDASRDIEQLSLQVQS